MGLGPFFSWLLQTERQRESPGLVQPGSTNKSKGERHLVPGAVRAVVCSQRNSRERPTDLIDRCCCLGSFAYNFFWRALEASQSTRDRYIYFLQRQQAPCGAAVGAMSHNSQHGSEVRSVLQPHQVCAYVCVAMCCPVGWNLLLAELHVFCNVSFVVSRCCLGHNTTYRCCRRSSMGASGVAQYEHLRQMLIYPLTYRLAQTAADAS